MAKLGFVPNRAAQVMKTGRTGTSRSSSRTSPTPTSDRWSGPSSAPPASADLQVLLADTSEHPREEIRAARTFARDVDGFVVLSPRRLHRDARRPRREAGGVRQPTRRRSRGRCCCAAPPQCTTHCSIWPRSVTARLVFLGGPTGSWAAAERRAAVRKTGRAAGLEVVSDGRRRAHVRGGRRCRASCGRGAGFTAVIAFNDQMALGVIAGLVPARHRRSAGT